MAVGEPWFLGRRMRWWDWHSCRMCGGPGWYLLDVVAGRSLLHCLFCVRFTNAGRVVLVSRRIRSAIALGIAGARWWDSCIGSMSAYSTPLVDMASTCQAGGTGKRRMCPFNKGTLVPVWIIQSVVLLLYIGVLSWEAFYALGQNLVYVVQVPP